MSSQPSVCPAVIPVPEVRDTLDLLLEPSSPGSPPAIDAHITVFNNFTFVAERKLLRAARLGDVTVGQGAKQTFL